MNFTAAGRERIKTREFLLMIQQLNDSHEALIFLSIAACSDENGTLVVSSEDEPFYFVRSHREQLADLMMDVQAEVIAMQNASCNIES